MKSMVGLKIIRLDSLTTLYYVVFRREQRNTRRYKAQGHYHKIRSGHSHKIRSAETQNVECYNGTGSNSAISVYEQKPDRYESWR